MTWTPEQIETHVRSIQRRCKGHYLLGAEDRSTLQDYWHQLDAEHNFAKGVAFKQAIETAMNAGEAPIANNDWEALLRRVSGLIYACRNNCGYDFNDYILSHDLDGIERHIECPGCGTTITYTPPTFS